MTGLSSMARNLGLALLLAGPSTLVAALDYNICSSFNTADMDVAIWQYQTNGWCSNHCEGDYAYAITQGTSCWCSNYTPSEGSELERSSCNTPCPAYPEFEQCGGDGAFSYIRIANNISPSGTRGPNNEATKTTTSQQNTLPPASTSPQEPASSTTLTTSSAAPSTTDSSTSARAVSHPPSTSVVQTVTADGTVRTVTIITQPTSTGDSGSSDGADQSSGEESGGGGGGGLGTGATVGIVVGVILAVLAIAGVGLFLFFRRRKRTQAEAGFENDPSVRGGGSPGVGSSNSRSEMGMVGTPMSPGSLATTRRNSQLQIDPRMDPFKNGLYGANASRESINTLRDDHDYSRRIQPPKVLRATNPDVDEN